MENFFISFYDFYLGLFFDFPIFNYQEWISLVTTLFFTLSQSFLYYIGIFFTLLEFIFHIPENWIFVEFLWWRIEYYHLFFLSLIFLFSLNIFTFFVWKYFWRKREKVKSNKINFYIIFFQFFPIIWFVWNFIAWKNYEVSLWKMLLKNIFAVGMIFLWLLWYVLMVKLFFNSVSESSTYIFYSFFSPILLWIWAYFYYFKIKN